MPPPAEGFAARFVIGPALRAQPDRRLVTLVREGYENAFEEIVRRYGKPLTRYAAAIVGSRAEDVTQDSFSKALLALRRDGAEIELRPWLFRIVRNTALNDLRDSPPSAEALAEVIAGGGAGPAEELERREELADLMRRLQSLPEAQRAAIVMRELEGLSHEEIAGALGLSDGGARQAIYRARRSLRDAAGMLLPLPLLKAMLAGAAGSPAVEAAAGAAGVGGAAGAGVALKAAAATVLVAGAVGAGVAIDHGRQPHRAGQATTSEVVADDSAQAPSRVTTAGHEGTSGSGSSSGSGPKGEREPGDDHGGHRRGHGSGKSGDGQSGPSSSSGDDGTGENGGNRGPGGGGGHDGTGDDHSGGPGPSGHDGSEDGGSQHSGRSSGSSSGSGGGGSSDGSGTSGGGGSSGDSGGSGGSSESGSGSSGDGSGSTSDGGSGSGSGSDSGGGSGSGSGDSGPGGEIGGNEPSFDDSGDSHGGSGFSVQTEPET